jgi:hypothetical protein
MTRTFKELQEENERLRKNNEFLQDQLEHWKFDWQEFVMFLIDDYGLELIENLKGSDVVERAYEQWCFKKGYRKQMNGQFSLYYGGKKIAEKVEVEITYNEPVFSDFVKKVKEGFDA